MKSEVNKEHFFIISLANQLNAIKDYDSLLFAT